MQLLSNMGFPLGVPPCMETTHSAKILTLVLSYRASHSLYSRGKILKMIPGGGGGVTITNENAMNCPFSSGAAIK